MKTVHVLLVEDNPADVELVREALDLCDFTNVLHVASDFEEARDYVQRVESGAPCPDILLLDLNLPKGSGLELLRIFRAQPKCQHVPAIIVSSSNAPRDRELTAQLGVAHYFRKPADLDEFMKLGPLVESTLAG